MAKIINDETLKEWMQEYPGLAYFLEESDTTIELRVTLYKDKWKCENCNHSFNDPDWLEGPNTETPLCPKCGSMNIDLTKSILDYIKTVANKFGYVSPETNPMNIESLISKSHRFFVVGSALTKAKPRDVDIVCIMDDRLFETTFDLKGEILTRLLLQGDEATGIKEWWKANDGATRILQTIHPELVPIDFKYLPRSLLKEPNLEVDITKPSDTWGIGKPNLKNHLDEKLLEE